MNKPFRSLSTALVVLGLGATTISSVNAETIQKPVATLNMHNGEDLKKYTITDLEMTFEELAEKHNFSLSMFRGRDGSAIDPEMTVAENPDIYKRTIGAETFEVEIPYQTVEKETDELYEGETKVKQKGKKGVAIKTVVTEKNPKGVDLPVTVTESLSLSEKPKEKIVLKGTKERPIPLSDPAEENTGVTEVSGPSASPSSSGPASRVTNRGGSRVAHVKQAKPTLPKDMGANPDAEKIISIATSQVGKPYIWGATGPSAFDCSGLVLWTYSKLGYKLPRVADAQGLSGKPVSWSNIQPGDLMWNSGHIAIYIGDGKYVHASTPTRGVVIDRVSAYTMNKYRVSRPSK